MSNGTDYKTADIQLLRAEEILNTMCLKIVNFLIVSIRVTIFFVLTFDFYVNNSV